MNRLHLILAGLLYTTTAPLFAIPVDFHKDVKPVLEFSCVKCHGPDKQSGELQLHTKVGIEKGGDSGAVIVPGKPGESLLIKLISLPHEDGDIMPAKGKPLSQMQILVMRQWIEDGAVFPKNEGLIARESQKPKLSGEDLKALDALMNNDGSSTVNEIAARVDALLDLENKKRDLPVAKEVNDLSYLRRVYVDLVGRIPRMDEIQAYIQAPKDERRVNLVDQLLEDERFSDRWTVFFADMIRIRSNAPGGNQLLAYVRNSIAEGKPYDLMVREMVSSNGHPGNAPEVGYILAENADPMALAAQTAQTFLGVRLQCAQCHDHPFDHWKQKEFYEFAGFFGKTKRIESNFSKVTYTTESDEMAVKWPPEGKAEDADRKGVNPNFPLEFVSLRHGEQYVDRLSEKRLKEHTHAAATESIDDLLDGVDATVENSGRGLEMLDVASDLKKDKQNLDIKGDLYRNSELRHELAGRITNPKNPYFARAFVNRVVNELLGSGFFMPIDDYSENAEIYTPETMEFLAREFVASGYDLRSLVRIIVHTKAYRRGHLPPETDHRVVYKAERCYTAAPVRRMLSEVLYDSIVEAGHLTEFKWPAGANIRTVERTERVVVNEDGEVVKSLPGNTSDEMAMTAMQPGMAENGGGGYSLEQGIALDFGALLKKTDVKDELAMMKEQSDAELERKMAMAEMNQNRRPPKYTYRTITETIDENPRFTSTMYMATPAPPAHFLRVFGQPAREALGEFREVAPSMRQALMMLNGQATHEAARVGPMEPIYKHLVGDDKDFGKAIQRAYLEIHTRLPSSDELADGLALVEGGPDPLSGMADLRWAMLNSHEFKYLP
jgi:hypothetical protein